MTGRRRGLWLVFLVVLFGFGLRIYRLDAQSMWSDEGLSHYRATLPLAEVLANTITVDGVPTRDTNPPFYFLLLNLWQRMAGDAVFTLRYLSIFAGTLAVPLLYLLGRLLVSRPVGLLAAFLLALSPFHVWMAQELRNYSLLLLLNLLAVYGLFRFVLRPAEQRRWRWFALWLGAGVLGIVTHYFGFFVFVFGLLVLAIHIIWQRRRPPVWFLIAGGIALLLLLPVAFVALERFQAGRQVDYAFLPVSAIIQQALDAFSVGISPNLRQPAGRVWPVVLVAVAGLGLLIRQRKTRAVWLLAGYAAVPLGILLLLSQINPLYNGPRHVLFALPPFLLLTATGIGGWPGRWRGIGLVAGLFIFLSQGQWLWIQFHDPALAKDDVRGVALFLNEHARPEDTIVLHDTLIRHTFDYYYAGDAPVVAVPPLWQQDAAAATETLAAVEGEHVWFLVQPTPRTGFPREALWEWADRQWPRFADLSFAGLWLRVGLNGYTPDPTVAGLPAGAKTVDITFGNALQLHGVQWPDTLTAGETAWPVFYLSRREPVPGNYTFSLRFVDETGNIWQQVDQYLWRRYPPVDWPAGDMQHYDHTLSLPAGLPPGVYTVLLRVLDPELQPLPASSGGVDADLGTIQVRAGQDVNRLPAFTAQRARIGPVTLLGYTLPDSAARPGHALPVTLYWQVQRPPVTDYQLRARLLNPAGEVLAETITAPTRAGYPPRQWQPDDLLQGQASLLIPGRALNEPHQVEIALLDPASGQPVARPVILDQPVLVEPWPLETAFPAIPDPLAATFGEPALIELAGYDLAPADGQLALTLFWRSIAGEIPDNYRVFVHLVDGGGNIVAQADGFPVQGARPPAGWRNGEAIIDTHNLPLPPDLPAGTYALYVGLYNPDTSTRLPVFVSGNEQADGRLFLQEVPNE